MSDWGDEAATWLIADLVTAALDGALTRDCIAVRMVGVAVVGRDAFEMRVDDRATRVDALVTAAFVGGVIGSESLCEAATAAAARRARFTWTGMKIVFFMRVITFLNCNRLCGSLCCTVVNQSLMIWMSSNTDRCAGDS